MCLLKWEKKESGHHTLCWVVEVEVLHRGEVRTISVGYQSKGGKDRPLEIKETALQNVMLLVAI